jgi:hypothetical protein
MLSSDVLEELLQPTRLRDLQPITAWPSFSTESKLQILQSVQKANWGAVGDSLLKLALDDSQPIVRYWALRYERLYKPDQPITQQARSDSHPLVRAMASASDGFANPEEDNAQLIRLVKLRNIEFYMASLQNIVDGFITAIETRSIPDEMLGDCMHEFLTGGWLRKHLSVDELSNDGWKHFNDIQQIKRLWEVTRKAEKRTAHQVGWYAPIRVERENVLDELFASLPLHVAIAVINRNEPESRELAKRVEESPKKFAPELLDEIKKIHERSLEFPELDQDEMREQRTRQAVNRDDALLDVMLELRREVGGFREAITAKTQHRGFFR